MAILVPARNEEESLPELLASLARHAAAARVVVVDNGSTDATAAVARAAGAVVVSAPRPGYGGACQAGLRVLAVRPGGAPDVVVFLDADDHRAPAQIEELLHPIRTGRADVVIGERRRTERGVRVHAALGNRFVSAALRGLYRSPTRDMGPFRAVTWECLRRLALDDPDFGWYVQMQVRALRSGFRVVGIPVDFERRRRGRSKISGSVAGSAAAGWVMLRTLAAEALREPPERRPYTRAAAREGTRNGSDR